MKLFLLTVTSFFIAYSGKWGNIKAFEPYSQWFLWIGFFMLWLWLLSHTYYISGHNWPETDDKPKKIRLNTLDALKALVSWFNAFQRTYAIAPGLYYTGDRYDPELPLLVTSNYHMTVFLLLRAVHGFSIRLLVIDTDGINVWCAAGKGAFNNTAIMKQINRFQNHLIADGKKIELVLPKLALSGVDLHGLRQEGIRPVIGPIKTKTLPAFLSQTKLEDQTQDVFLFDFKSRLFTWLPGLVQYMLYGLILVMGLLGIEAFWGLRAPMGIIPLIALLTTVYPLLFPWLPGRGFAVKGLWLAGSVGVAMAGSVIFNLMTTHEALSAIVFVFAVSIFFGLSYTGNSPVSNYTRVRRETARFLPINVILFLTSFVLYLF
ncbi:MAG: hypothetical protein C0403_14400 [Desulfobacterium sp.]|nr:hypothetical protein [Desulfobacterium sp.]